MSVTQQVSLERSCVICTIYSHGLKRVIGQCKILANVSWKIAFTFRKLCPTANTGSSALRAPFLPRLQLLPGTRGNISHLFILCRGVSFQKRSKPCCTTGRTFLSTLPWCGAQSLIQANHCLLRTTHAYPIHASRLCPWYSPPTMKYLGVPCGPS
jgi:hypothetical protein